MSAEEDKSSASQAALVFVFCFQCFVKEEDRAEVVTLLQALQRSGKCYQERGRHVLSVPTDKFVSAVMPVMTFPLSLKWYQKRQASKNWKSCLERQAYLFTIIWTCFYLYLCRQKKKIPHRRVKNRILKKTTTKQDVERSSSPHEIQFLCYI